MPFKSERQRRYMHAKLPKLAAKWEHEYGSTPRPTPTHGKLRRKKR